MTQVKIIAPADVVEKFKKIVFARHKKLELSVEGQEALKMYIKKHEHLLHELCPPEKDPLSKICGIGKSADRHNALDDLKKLDAGKL